MVDADTAGSRIFLIDPARREPDAGFSKPMEPSC
jgi:hypothetical protein